MSLKLEFVNIHLDSCAFDPKYSPEDKAAETILRLCKEQKLNYTIAHSVLKEIEHPNTPSCVKREAASTIFTIVTTLTNDEEILKQKIWDILVGNGSRSKMKQDAIHVFEAHKYGAYFITTDERILKKRSQIEKISNVKIMSPSELVLLIGLSIS